MQRLRDAQQRIDLIRESLGWAITHYCSNRQALLASCMRALQGRSPVRELTQRKARLQQLERALLSQPTRLLENGRQRFRQLDGMLRLLGPDATLARGYSMTTTSTGELIRSREAVSAGTTVRTRVLDGTFSSEVVD
jgi:exodeoxyribonuclease VII large subunit